MLSLQELHDGQNHSFSNFSSSDERNFSKELLTLSAMGTDTMSSFSSLTAELKQLLYVIVVFKVLERVNHQLLLMFPAIRQILLAGFLEHPAGS